MASIDSRIERIPNNKYNKKLLFISGLGYTFDAMDMAIIAFILPSVVALWNLSSGQTGLLGSSVLMGYFFGSLFSGILGDMIGRKRIIMWTLFIYTFATIISSFAMNWQQFFWMRIIAGIGIGGESAIIAPYLSELVSSKFRGKYVGSLSGFFSFGYVGAAIISYVIIPVSDFGWRIALLLTAVPIFLVIYWRRVLPESPRWYESKGRLKEADQTMTEIEGQVEKYISRKLPEPVESTEKQIQTNKGNFLTLWNGTFIKSTCMLWILWFSIVFAYYGFFTWLPTLLYNQGYEISKSFLFSIIIYLAQIPGYFSAAYLNDIIGRKKVIVAYLGLGALAALLLSQSHTATMIIISGFLMSLFMTGTFSALYAYTPEQYPTIIRSTGTGSASSFGRIGGLLAPIIIGYAYPFIGFVGVFLLSMIVLLVGMLSVLILGNETKSKSLDEIMSGKQADLQKEFSKTI